MKFVLGFDEMRDAEGAAIDSGLNEDILIETAANSAVKIIEEKVSKMNAKSFGVFFGTGNNGADGLSIARLIHMIGGRVTAVQVGKNPNRFVQERIRALKYCGVEVIFSREATFDFDVIIDCIFGIGLSRKVESETADIIASINQSPAYTISIDMPSGLNENGYPMETAVEADLTVSFSAYKIGQLINNGRNYTGEIEVVDIGINCDSGCAVYEKEDFIEPPRKTVTHKNNFGVISIIAGSGSMPGAALLAHGSAIAALKSGGGLVSLVTAQSLENAFNCRVKEEMLTLLPDENGFIKSGNLNDVKSRSDVIVVGMGMGKNPYLSKILRELSDFDGTLIIDGDGLNTLSQDKSVLENAKCRIILTPHIGEFRRLVPNCEDLIEGAKMLARELGAVIAVKSATTIITDGENIAFNITGCPAMAKGGSGDVLAGIIAAYSARFAPFYAVCKAAYDFGKSGERAAKCLGENAVLPTDLYLE